MTDIKRFCCRENGTVLGIDKTYNLGDFHVTPIVYKDLSVLRRATGENPTCFGPTFIHQSSTTASYSTFLNSIANNLNDHEISNLVIGSDEELAFKNAIRRNLPGATHVLCTRHLKENSNRHMENIVGYPKKERDHILLLIYGAEGLVENTDSDSFNYRLKTIYEEISAVDNVVGEKKNDLLRQKITTSFTNPCDRTNQKRENFFNVD